jgi:hypothetical protein
MSLPRLNAIRGSHPRAWSSAKPTSKRACSKEAVAEFEKASNLDSASSMYAACRAHVLALAGRRAEALKVLEGLNQGAGHGFICSYDRAIAYVGLGDREKSFELLNAAVQEHSPRGVSGSGPPLWRAPYRFALQRVAEIYWPEVNSRSRREETFKAAEISPFTGPHP